jgi:hypothetical protein
VVTLAICANLIILKTRINYTDRVYREVIIDLGFGEYCNKTGVFKRTRPIQ